MTEETFRALLESASVGVVMVDGAGQIVFANAMAEEMFGYRRAELLGQNVEMLLPEGLRNIHVEHRADYVSAPRMRPMGADLDLVGRRKDGTEFPVEIGLSAVEPEAGLLVASFITDISERRRAEEMLHETQRALSTLMGNLPGMAYRCDNDRYWTMQFVSEGAYDLTGYRPSELVGNRRIAYAQLIHPAERERVQQEVEAALQEKRPFQLTYRITTASGEEKWVWEQGCGVFSAGGDLLALEGFITDITERVAAYQALEDRVDARARELSTLLSIQQAISSRLDPDAVLQLIADEARELASAEQGAVYLLDSDELEIAVISGDVSAEMVGARLPVDGSVAGLAVRSGEPVLVADTQADPRVYQEIPRRVGARAFVIVPLMASSGPIGTITVANRRPRTLGPHAEQVLTMLASSAVIGIENARGYQEEQRRRLVAEGLREILTILNSDRPLDEILDYIVSQARRLLDSDACVAYRLVDGDGVFRIQASDGFDPDLAAMRMPVGERIAARVLQERRPVAFSDLKVAIADQQRVHDAKLDPQQRVRISQLTERYQAQLVVPLVVKDEVYGGIVLYYQESKRFTDDEIGLAATFADQAALAIENARLRAQVQASAVAAERSRLARDLHDAVTQTLFSASLIAEVLPRLWERSPEEGRRRLEELRQLTRGALAEMRTLLLELRPAALIEADLGDVLRQLAESVIGRARVPIEVELEGECALPPDVKVGLYRIAQEALNNVAKHAEADQATVSLRCAPGRVELRVSDDGRGFNPAGISSEHLGLDIMRERAEAIGARLQIDSQPGRGTQVTAVWRE